MENVYAVTNGDIKWSFDDSRPYVLVGGGRYPRRHYVDPFPCYAHDLALVERLVSQVKAVWPVPWEVYWYLLPVEDQHRTNGWTQLDPVEWGEKGRATQWRSSIAFAGKRIPLHPAMTRYLVAHEYGHVVEDALLHSRGIEPGTDSLVQEYRNLRGRVVEPTYTYGGQTWHQSDKELLANDFRLLVANSEPEFWPHPDISRPEEVPAVVEWWARQGGSKITERLLAALEQRRSQVDEAREDAILDMMDRLVGWCSAAVSLAGEPKETAGG